MDILFNLARITPPIPRWLGDLLFNIVVEAAKFFTKDLIKRAGSNTTLQFWYSVLVLGAVALWIYWIWNRLTAIMLDEARTDEQSKNKLNTSDPE